MMKYIISIVFIFALAWPLSAQKEIKYSRQGNRDYNDKSFDDAELLYRRSFDENPSYSDAMFNLGDALYKQEKYQDATENFTSLVSSEIDPLKKSTSYYNLGNSLLKENKLEESIEAYKNSLRLNPDMMEAKYNLAYAQDQMQKQEEQEQNKQDQSEENKDKNQDKNKDKEDKQDDNQDQDQQNNQEENNEQDPEDQDQDNNQDQEQMSKEDAERLLQALAADEQEVQDKVKKAKASSRRVRTLKNW